jgi:hypothetical protein
MTKRKLTKKQKKIIIIIVIVLILVLGGLLGYRTAKSVKSEIPVKIIEVLETIDGYGYSLEDRDTEIYKEKYYELKSVLEEEIDYEKYASLLAELFSIDLYTIDNKTNKYDVGSLDFIYPDEQDKFKSKVMDTMYKLVEDNSTNTREQTLPIVKSTEVTNIKKDKYTKDGTTLPSYEVTLTNTYEEDLGYDKNIKVTMVLEDNKLYVVSTTSLD